MSIVFDGLELFLFLEKKIIIGLSHKNLSSFEMEFKI